MTPARVVVFTTTDRSSAEAVWRLVTFGRLIWLYASAPGAGVPVNLPFATSHAPALAAVYKSGIPSEKSSTFW